jgi:hypothetical protein
VITTRTHQPNRTPRSLMRVGVTLVVVALLSGACGDARGLTNDETIGGNEP